MNAPELAERIAAITGMSSEAITRLLTRGGLAALGAEADQLRSDYLAAQRRRQDDEKALNDVRENDAARQLFHGLEPRACPRCDTPISEQRRLEEYEHNRCAICTSELPGATEDASDAEIAARLRLAISEAEETAALARLRNVEVALARSVAEAAEVPEQRRPD